MNYTTLGNSSVRISTLCLGTMTWGQQNTEREAHQQLDCATSHGINVIDTAEIYPVPPQAQTQGRTEEYLGTWLAQGNNREKVVLASKVAGPSSHHWLRGERARFSRQHIRSAIHGSLRRLKCDYIDLYQLHWPERSTNYFGTLNYRHVEEEAIPLSETLLVLQELIQEGLIKYIGLCNEVPWGVLESLRLHEQRGLPRIMSVQNPYSLLNRSYEVGMAEISIRERCGLLAYSVLGFGVLTGKYISGHKGRVTLWPDHFSRYSSEQAAYATRQYVALASKYGLSPVQLALSFVAHQPFVTSTIIGATSVKQLEENIKASEVTLSEEILQEIETIERHSPFPSP